MLETKLASLIWLLW